MKRLLIVAMAVAAVVLSQRDRVLSQSKPAVPAPSQEWPTYNHDPGGARFSPLTQISPANVGQLEVAWVYHMRPEAPPAPPAAAGAAPPAAPGRGRGRGGSGFSASETTPLVVNGVMYIASPYGRVVALEPTTGKEVWVYQLPAGSPSTP